MIICSYNTYEPFYFSISFVFIHPNRPTIKTVDHYCDEWDAGKAKRNNQFEYLKEKNKRGKIDAKDDMRLLKTLLSNAVNVRKYRALDITGDQLPHCRYSFLSRPESQNKQIHDWSVVRVTSREDSQRPRKSTLSLNSAGLDALKSVDGSIYGNSRRQPTDQPIWYNDADILQL